jgi:peptidoglycan/LPS O-acetylase OafA/YrhL
MITHLTFSPLLFGSVIGLVLTSQPGAWLLKVLSFRPLRAIGKYSYAV